MNRWTLAILAGLVATETSRAVDSQMTPSADAFVAASQPMNNYGGGGSLAMAGSGSPNGEFQILLRFDFADARASFDTTYGAGRWSLAGATLRMSSANPVNPLYNLPAAGMFAVLWTANDGWTEGTGTPGMPAATGVNYASLPSLLGAADEGMGVFAYSGLVSMTDTYTLSIGSGFRADAASGGAVTLRIAPMSDTVAMLINSRSFSFSGYAPVLTLTARATCEADFDGVPGLAIQDIFAFLNSWFAGESRADFDHSGGLAVQDIFAFLNAWFAGCA